MGPIIPVGPVTLPENEMHTSTMNKHERLSIAGELRWYAETILKDLAAAEALVVGQGMEEMEASRLQWISAIREAVNGTAAMYGMKDAAKILVDSADQYE
jgi:hypothetical protein